jgi:pyruvate-formate lyase-activating enzyme
MQFAEIAARDTIERLAASGSPYAVTRTDLVAAARLIPRAELVQRFAGDDLLLNFVLNHWEFAHGVATLTTYPWNIVIPIADICNARCVFCNSWLRGKRLLQLTELERFGPVLKTAAMISLEGHGEPLFHPKFGDIARQLRLTVDPRCRFSIITNGLLLDERLDELLAMGVNVFNVSLNAATAQTHETVMGLGVDAFERVTRTLRDLSRRGGAMEVGQRPAVNLSMAVTSMNVHEIASFIQLAESLGASQVNLRTLLPQTGLLAGLNYHVLPPYLAPDFERHVAAAKSAIAATSVTVDADVASWSKPIFPQDVQQRIDASPPKMVDRLIAQRVVVLQRSDYKGLENLRSKGELLPAGEGDPRWTTHEKDSPDSVERKAWFKCSDVYTTLHMNDFFFVLRPCCYMDAVPNHDVIKYDGDGDFFGAWNSPAMVSLRQRLRDGPLYSMCRRCPQQLQYPGPEPRIGDYESVPGALGTWEVHHWTGSAQDRGAEGVLIVTPEAQWAYAALAPLRVQPAGIGGRIVVDVQVEQGAVGVCLLHSKEDSLIAEIARDSVSAIGPVTFRVADLSVVRGLLLRNRSAQGLVSKAAIRSVELQQRCAYGELAGYRIDQRLLNLHDLSPTTKAASATWIERDEEFQTLSGGNRMWQAEPHWDAVLVEHGEDGTTITTSTAQWAYAAMMQLQSDGDQFDVRVLVDLEVEAGVVGIGMLDSGGQDFVTEFVVSAASPSGAVCLRFGDLTQVRTLVIRNRSTAGERGRVRVRSVRVQALRAQGLVKYPYLVGVDGRVQQPHANGPALSSDIRQPERGLRISGGKLPWASLAIAQVSPTQPAISGPGAVCVRIRVEQGQVLVGLLDKSGELYLSQAFRGASAEPCDVVLHCDALEELSAVVIRSSNLVEQEPIFFVSGISLALCAESHLNNG